MRSNASRHPPRRRPRPSIRPPRTNSCSRTVPQVHVASRPDAARLAATARRPAIAPHSGTARQPRAARQAGTLRRLATPWLFALAWLLGGLSLPGPVVADDALTERRNRIAAMTAAEKEQLARRYERFLALSAAEQDRLRALHQALEEDPTAEELRAVMLRYHRWLTRLPTAQRAELLAMDPEERLEKIRQLRAAERARQRGRLTAEDRQVVMRWLEQLVQARLPAEERKRLGSLPEQQRRAELARLAIQRRQQNLRLGTSLEENVRALREALSPRAQQALDAETTVEGRRALLAAWIRQALGDVYGRGPFRRREPPDPQVLLRFMNEELTPQERQQLTGLSEEALLLRLQRLYFQRQSQRNPSEPGPRRRPLWERNESEGERRRWP